jgi:proteic killer suppression protein
MRVRFARAELDRLETDSAFTGGYSDAVVRAFRRRMQQIRAALDERDFYAVKSLHFEKLKGARSHQRSIRLNDQWRLILELEGSDNEKTVLVVDIEDYH